MLLNFLYQRTLIDTIILIILGTICGFLSATLSQEFWYKFYENDIETIERLNRIRNQEYKGNKSKQLFCAYFASFLVFGFGFINCIFLGSNLMIMRDSQKNIKGEIIKVSKSINWRGWTQKRSLSSSSKIIATVKISGYLKKVEFPFSYTPTHKEGQLLNFSVRKSYFGFDVIEKLYLSEPQISIDKPDFTDFYI